MTVWISTDVQVCIKVQYFKEGLSKMRNINQYFISPILIIHIKIICSKYKLYINW